MKEFKKVANREKGFMTFTFIIGIIAFAVLMFNGKEVAPVITTMIWISLIGMSLVKVIEAAVEELKK